MVRRLVTLLIALCLLTTVAVAADWPHFFGPASNGMAPDTGLNNNWTARPPAVLWKIPLGDNGFTGPSVADGKVFILDHQGNQDVVRALRLQDGQEVWRFAYDQQTADEFGNARCTPTYADGKLYTVSATGVLLCLNAANGEPVWNKNLIRDFGGKRPQWWYSFSPLVDGDRVVVQTGSPSGNVAVLNKDNGDTIWVGGNTDGCGYATPIVADILGVRQYVIAAAASVVGVDRDNGRVLWSVPWKNKCLVNASQPVVAGNFVFITSGYAIGCALYEITPQGPQQRWANREISAHFSSPVFYDGFLYSNSDSGGGSLVCMSPQQGQVAWKQGGFEKGGLLIADGVIIAMDGRGGDVIMVKADAAGYQELGRIKPLGGQSWTAPILADGKLIVRNRQAMACLDLR